MKSRNWEELRTGRRWETICGAAFPAAGPRPPGRRQLPSIVRQSRPVLGAKSVIQWQRWNKRQTNCGAKHISKSKCTKHQGFGPLLEVQMPLRFTTLNYITLHYTTLHYATLHYTTLPSTTLHYITLHYTPRHYNYNYKCNYTTTLHYNTLHYTKLRYTTLHYTTLHSTTLTLHYTTLHYLPLHFTTLHYTTLHYTTTTTTNTQLHSTTLHYTKLHYTTLHYTFLFLKLPPPPCAVLSILILDISIMHNKCIYLLYTRSGRCFQRRGSTIGIRIDIFKIFFFDNYNLG